MRADLRRRIGVTLLATIFVACVAWVATRSIPAARHGQVTLRIAHDNLHDTMRRAWSDAVAAYERLHPEVHVEILEVPNMRDFYVNTWTRTQLIGGTAPDVMKVSRELSDFELATYFHPLTSWMGVPNPYNDGTPLAAVPWRETFLDGLTSRESVPPALMEIYRMPIFVSTTRFFYNRELAKAAMGTEEPPKSMREFLGWCDGLAAHARKTGLNYAPIAGGETAPALVFDMIFAAQTQALAADSARNAAHRSTAVDGATAYLRGDWSLDSPAVRTALELIRRIGSHMQPAFLQARRDEMSLLFCQQRAAMIASGSWDASYFLHAAPFRVGVFTLPVPAPGDAFHTRWILGPLSEAEINENGFGVTKNSAHPEVAIDFLRFLSSRAANARFCQTAERVPAIIGAPIAPQLRAFSPPEQQWPWGYTPGFSQLGGRWIDRALKVNLHRLFGQSGSVDTFLAAYRPEFEHALRLDAAHYLEQTNRIIRRTDAVIAVLTKLGADGDRAAAAKASYLFENQNLQETEALQLALAVAADPAIAPSGR